MTNSINWFRTAIPYIAKHKNNIFVIFLNNLSQINAKETLLDIAHLHTLGIKIILICGVRDKIEQCLREKNINSVIHNNLRITDSSVLECIKQSNALMKLEIEAILANHAKVISGNFVTAQPLGIIDGIDFQQTGKIRNIDDLAIKKQLDNIVLLSPLGFSATGEIFNINAEDLASITAIKLQANKLIILHENNGLLDKNQQLINECTASEAKLLSVDKIWKRYLNSAINACENNVARVHILNTQINGVLLQELFSCDGSGTMITTNPYETIRHANINDSKNIIALTKPLVKLGLLVHRDLSKIKQNIDNYYLLERDNKIIGTIALIIYETIGEIACVVIDKIYQNNGRGNRLLKYIEKIAKQKNLTQLFVLSTQTSHWFLERDFVASDLSQLPSNRNYDTKRNSKLYIKKI